MINMSLHLAKQDKAGKTAAKLEALTLMNKYLVAM